MRRPLLQLTARVPTARLGALSAVGAGPWERWEPGDAGRAIETAGVVRRLEAVGPDRFARIAEDADALWASIEDAREPGADDAPPPLLLGGLAFSPSAPARRGAAGHWRGFADASFTLAQTLLVVERGRAFLRVVVPATVGLAGARRRLAVLAARLTARARRPARRPRPSVAPPALRVEHMRPGVWRALVVDALDRLAARDLDKLVAARCSVVSAGGPFDAAAALERLRGPDRRPAGVLFSFARGGATFLGRSPERLVARRGRTVRADALAGTGADPEALAASAKDRLEHAIVVDAVRRALQPLCSTLEAPAAPRVRALPGLYHLWTPVTAQLREEASVLDLVQRLHPTPAVAGSPAAPALDWIAAHEPQGRGWYAGPVGWIDARGDGDFAVAIRSALLRGRRAFVWAGAGIVPASDPDREYDETRVKQGALLGALGVAP